MANRFEEEMVVKQLRQLGAGITANKEVIIARGTTALGNKSWGKVDFLINHRGYRLVRE